MTLSQELRAAVLYGGPISPLAWRETYKLRTTDDLLQAMRQMPDATQLQTFLLIAAAALERE